MKKMRSMVAMLICLVLLVSLCAVTASAAEPVSSNINFTELASVSAAGDETKAVMEGMGLIVPEGSVWEITDHFYKLAMPKEGYADTYYIQTLEAGEGKVLAADATLELAYALAALNETGASYEVGWVNVSVSTDGTNYTEVWANREGQGQEGTADVFAVPQITLTGTKGAAKIWVKVGVNRHIGPAGGAIGWSKISASVEAPLPSNAVQHVANFEPLTEFAGVTNSDNGDIVASKAKMEEMGLIVPDMIIWDEASENPDEPNNPWVLQNCINIFATPYEGHHATAYIQTLEAGEGKVLESDIVVTLKYWLAAGTGSYLVIHTSTDGETWTEAWADDEGQGKDWDASACTEKDITLEGTAGESKVYVRYVVVRKSGPVSGGIVKSVLTATTKAGTPSTPDTGDSNTGSGDNAPETGDMIAVAIALLAISGTGITVLKKRS